MSFRAERATTAMFELLCLPSPLVGSTKSTRSRISACDVPRNCRLTRVPTFKNSYIGANTPTLKTLGKSNLAKTYCAEKKYQEAEDLSRACLESFEKMFAADHPYVANCQSVLADVCIAEGKAAEALPLCEASLQSRKKAFPVAHPKVAHSLEQLGQVRELQGKNDQAISLYKESLSTYERAFGSNHHPDMDSLVQRYAAILEKTGHKAEAAELLTKQHSSIAANPVAPAPK